MGIQQMLLGSGGQRIDVFINMIQDFEVATTAIGAFTIHSDGTMSYIGTLSGGAPRWIDPGAPLQTYYCKLTLTGDAPTGSAVGSVLALTSNQTWTWSVPGVAVKNAACTLTIYADAAGLAPLDSTSFNVNVERGV